MAGVLNYILGNDEILLEGLGRLNRKVGKIDGSEIETRSHQYLPTLTLIYRPTSLRYSFQILELSDVKKAKLKL